MELHHISFCRVLNNLKEYAVKALVNAVDHLGTVAYKLNDLLSQQTSELSNVELHIDCLDQVLACVVNSNLPGIFLMKTWKYHSWLFISHCNTLKQDTSKLFAMFGLYLSYYIKWPILFVMFGLHLCITYYDHIQYNTIFSIWETSYMPRTYW